MMRTAWISLFVLSLLPAQEPVPLSHAVPRDMHFFVHGMTSQTPDPALARFERAVAMLAASGIHDDVLDLATMELSPRERQEVRGMVQHVWGLLGRVDWSLLGEREMVFAYRMVVPMPEYMVAFRVPEERVGEQLAGIREMLGGFAQMLGLPPDAVREVDRQSGTLTVFGVQGVPLEFAAGAVGDVLVLASSSRRAGASLRLLQQGADGRSLGASERFRHGLAKLPAAGEEVLFVDVRGLLDFYRQMLRIGLVGAAGEGRGARQSREVLDLLLTLLDEFDVTDHLQVTTKSDGRTTTSTMRVRLVDDFASTPMAAVVGRQLPWTDWHRRVPADALGFGFDTGVDLAALYDLTVERMRPSEFMSALLEEHRGMLDAARSGLGHFSGEVAWVSLPSTGPGGEAGAETVCFVRLAEPETIARRLPEWLVACRDFLASRGQHMLVHEADGIHEIELAAFPWCRPVVGVHGDEFIYATSAAALARVAAVQHGQAPSIRERPDFAALGLGARDTAEGLAYGQVTPGMAGIPDLVAAAGFVLSVLPADRDTRPLIKLGAIMTKLAPALRELDSGYDWGTEAVPGDEPDTWVIRSVWRYRDDR